MTTPARTIFLGSGGFAVPIVEALQAHPSVDLVALLTAPVRQGSRGRPTDTPVGEWAGQHGLWTLRPTRLRDPAALAEVVSLRPDLLVLADYGQIVPQVLLDLPRRGALNLHPSLLPRHRGASPLAAAILAGDRATGVSLMRMDAGLDSGPLIAQRHVPLTGRETAPELESDLAGVAAELLAASLGPWLDGALVPRAQPDEGVTLTKPLRREDGRLDPAKTAAELERQVRAYQPWPGSYIDTPNGRIIVWRAAVGAGANAPAGTLIALEGGRPALATTLGLLELVEVQPAGGRRMTGAELLRGRPTLVGALVA